MENKLESVINNDEDKAIREYTSIELRFMANADTALNMLEEALKNAIEHEKYCSFIYDSVHPDNEQKYNPCFRIENILNKYEDVGKTKQTANDDDKPSLLAPIKQIHNLK